LRAAAIMAQIDPVAKGYLVVDGTGHLRLPPLAALVAGVNLNAAGQTNLLVEYQIHNLSDADFVNSIPAVTQGPGAAAANRAQVRIRSRRYVSYNNFFRNVVFAYLSPERLMMIYDKGGLEELVDEVGKLRRLHVI
jgi:hypothetical protein